jgi:nitroimidazol reductase NimA-like FMN-containing flavoprotein (pyridoxamine 5'-phosphate oxidase superfamily)
MEVDPRAYELLAPPNLGHLGYHGLDGFPRVMPLWFAVRDGEIHFASPPNAYKGRALRADPRAMMTVSTPVSPYTFVTVLGRAVVEILPEPQRIELVREIAISYLGAEGGEGYVEKWIRGGHPGPGELIRLPIERLRFTDMEA